MPAGPDAGVARMVSLDTEAGADSAGIGASDGRAGCAGTLDVVTESTPADSPSLSKDIGSARGGTDVRRNCVVSGAVAPSSGPSVVSRAPACVARVWIAGMEDKLNCVVSGGVVLDAAAGPSASSRASIRSVINLVHDPPGRQLHEDDKTMARSDPNDVRVRGWRGKEGGQRVGSRDQALWTLGQSR